MPQVNMLIYWSQGAHMAGHTLHPQKEMERLGITYSHCTPQSMTDCWWFWNPSRTDNLPEYIDLKQMNPTSCIGWGLTEQAVQEIVNLAQEPQQ
ncbi:MAG: hypothetical protein ACRCWC_00805 [Plesiomonas shigelloides]